MIEVFSESVSDCSEDPDARLSHQEVISMIRILTPQEATRSQVEAFECWRSERESVYRIVRANGEWIVGFHKRQEAERFLPEYEKDYPGETLTIEEAKATC
jgi:hypothetical protein